MVFDTQLLKENVNHIIRRGSPHPAHSGIADLEASETGLTRIQIKVLPRNCGIVRDEEKR